MARADRCGVLHAIGVVVTAVLLSAPADLPLRCPTWVMQNALGAAVYRSATLRRIAVSLRERHAIVYVRWNPVLPRLVNGAVRPRVVVGGEVRYLWIDLRPDEVSDRLMAVIAHEAQHALEILDSGLEDSAAVTGMYRRLSGHGQTHVYDTAGARDAGRDVARELKAHSRGAG